MNFGNLIIITFLTYYTVYIIRLFNRKNRAAIRKVNIALDEMREKTFKTLEEQKEFINTKYPKRGKFVFTWNVVLNFFISFLIYAIVFSIYLYLFTVFAINISFWLVLLIVFTFPFIMDYILNKFNLEKGDLRHIFKTK